MKFSQVVIAASCGAVLVFLLGWGIFAIPRYLAFQEQLAIVREQQREDAAQIEQGKEPEFYQANPFFTSVTVPPGPHPQLEVKEPLMHQFGEMIQGETGAYSFTIYNVGEAPLKVVRGPVECKCTMGELNRDGIPPGETGELKLEYAPNAEGQFIKHATFFTNDPDHPALTVGIVGMVVADLAVIPANGWSLGPVPPDTPRTLELRLLSSQTREFEVSGVETSAPERLSFVVEENRSLEGVDIDFASGYLLKGVLRVGDEPGVIHESVTIHTNYPGRETIVLPVTGSVLGPIEIFSRYWDARSMRIDLGVVETSTDHEFPLMLLLEPAEEELRVLEVKCLPEFVKFDVQKAGMAGERQRYRMTLTIPQGAPLGDWTNRNEGEILLKTNHPKMSEVRFKLSLTTQ